MKILVIAPHPDDEVLGCGGTIARYSQQGDEVYLCIVTKGYAPDWSEEFIENRKNEVAKANQVLGVRRTFYLDFPTVKLDTIPQKELIAAIIKVIDETEPEIVYIPHKGDLNKDHRLVFEATLVSLRPAGERKVKKVLSYETLSGTEWGAPLGSFTPNLYVDISSTINTKIEAMKAYYTEIKQYPHPRSLEMIEVSAKKRGSEVGLEFAEAFEVIREIDG